MIRIISNIDPIDQVINRKKNGLGTEAVRTIYLNKHIRQIVRTLTPVFKKKEIFFATMRDAH